MRIAGLPAEFNRVRYDGELLSGLLRRVAASDIPVWPIVTKATTLRPLDDADKALVAQIVAPYLSGMTPGSVRRRLAMGHHKS